MTKKIDPLNPLKISYREISIRLFEGSTAGLSTTKRFGDDSALPEKCSVSTGR